MIVAQPDTDRAGSSPVPPRSVAIVPARAGSKRVPGKNLRPLKNRPLLMHTLEAAVASGLFTHVFVSTDSAEIREVAEAAGAWVPELRDATLADDFAPVSEVTAAALDVLDRHGQEYDYVAQLLPTCPLRTADDIVASFSAFVEDTSSPLVSVTEVLGGNPWWAVTVSPDRTLSLLHPSAFEERSQDLPDSYVVTGAIWWIEARRLRTERQFYLPGLRAWEIPWPRGLDIDSERELALATLIAESDDG